MNLGKYIFGTRTFLLEKVEENARQGQYRAYNLLALMFYTLVFACFVSGIVYGLVLFNSWPIALIIGLFLGFISFVLLILVLFLNMTTNHQDLYNNMTNMSPIFKQYEGQDFTHLSDEEAIRIVHEQKMLLRETNHTPSFDHFHISGIFSSAIKVILILVISCVVANAMELLMFRNALNSTLAKVESSADLHAAAGLRDSTGATHLLSSDQQQKQVLAQWTLDMLKEDPNKPFILINSQSILLSLDILDMSIGKFKVVMDILFALLFLTPFILVRKSHEYGGGELLKEAALMDISISFYSFLITQRESQKIINRIQNEYDYNALAKIPKVHA
jgi:hypothetical protein